MLVETNSTLGEAASNSVSNCGRTRSHCAERGPHSVDPAKAVGSIWSTRNALLGTAPDVAEATPSLPRHASSLIETTPRFGEPATKLLDTASELVDLGSTTRPKLGLSSAGAGQRRQLPQTCSCASRRARILGQLGGVPTLARATLRWDVSAEMRRDAAFVGGTLMEVVRIMGAAAAIKRGG